jgi:hypothetical protein
MLHRAARGRGRSRDRVVYERRRCASHIQSNQHRTAAAIGNHDGAGKEWVANRIGGGREVARFRRDLYLGGTGPQTIG